MIPPRVLVAFAILAVAVLLGPAAGHQDGRVVQGAQDPSGPIVLGVLRSDGVLLPFASFSGRRWSSRWPAGISGRQLPVTLADVPDSWWGGAPPEQWRLWPQETMGSPRPLAPVVPVLVPVGRTSRLGLRTDFTPSPPAVPASEFPFPKAGLAVGGDVTIQPITLASVTGAAAQQLVERLRGDIHQAEERAITALRGQARWTHPIPREARAPVVPHLEAWYTAPIAGSGSTLSYIEAVKLYPPLPDDDGCGLESFVTGWIHHEEEDRKLRAELRAVVTYCDREGALYMLPFGTLVLNDRTHWVFQMSGRRSEWYVVLEATPGGRRIVAEYHAGDGPPESVPGR